MEEIFLAENLRMLRSKFGYTLEAVSEIIGVSRQSVSKWELGETFPDILNCIKLAKLYKVALDDLISYPMKMIGDGENAPYDGRAIVLTEISDDNTIKLPKSVMTLFSLSPGDKLLMLADEKQGIGLVRFGDISPKE